MFQSLIDFINAHKATGTTEALIEAAEHHHGWFVVATASEAARRAASLPGVNVISMENLCDSDAAWMWKDGPRGPLFIDPKAIVWLAERIAANAVKVKED